MKIEILGVGCQKCRHLEMLARDVVQELGLSDVAIEKVERLEDIIAFGVFSTPGLVIDGTVVLQGRVPARATLRDMIAKASCVS